MKPDNVFIMDDGTVKLGDFGIAKVLAATTETSNNQQSAGTLCYMPPESFKKGGQATYAGDIWAVGCILREMLTRGTVTFMRKDRPKIEKAIRYETPDRLPQKYSRELRALIW